MLENVLNMTIHYVQNETKTFTLNILVALFNLYQKTVCFMFEGNGYC